MLHRVMDYERLRVLVVQDYVVAIAGQWLIPMVHWGV